MKHEELRQKLNFINDLSHSAGNALVKECLIYLMDNIQPKRSKREDTEDWGNPITP